MYHLLQPVQVCSNLLKKNKLNWYFVLNWQVITITLLLKSIFKGHCAHCGLLCSLILPCFIYRLLTTVQHHKSFPIHIFHSLYLYKHNCILPEFWFLYLFRLECKKFSISLIVCTDYTDILWKLDERWNFNSDKNSRHSKHKSWCKGLSTEV